MLLSLQKKMVIFKKKMSHNHKSNTFFCNDKQESFLLYISSTFTILLMKKNIKKNILLFNNSQSYQISSFMKKKFKMKIKTKPYIMFLNIKHRNVDVATHHIITYSNNLTNQELLALLLWFSLNFLLWQTSLHFYLSKIMCFFWLAI